MLGSGDPTPYDIPAAIALGMLALLALIGCFAGNRWSPEWVIPLRYFCLGLALAIVALVYILTPTPNGIAGAGRIFMLWLPLAANLLLIALWFWRSS